MASWQTKIDILNEIPCINKGIIIIIIIIINIKHLCSSKAYKHNLQIWSRLGDLVRCILSFNFGAQELYI